MTVRVTFGRTRWRSSSEGVSQRLAIRSTPSAPGKAGYSKWPVLVYRLDARHYPKSVATYGHSTVVTARVRSTGARRQFHFARCRLPDQTLVVLIATVRNKPQLNSRNPPALRRSKTWVGRSAGSRETGGGELLTIG